MKSKLTYILTTVTALLLIVASGCLGWFFLSRAGNLQDKYGDALLERYASTGNLSYLLEATIINPNKSNLRDTSDILLQNGEYQTAETINYFLRDPDFNLKAAEAALFNLNFAAADNYLGQLPKTLSKQELVIFQAHLTEYSDTIIEWEPQTDAGKLLTMVTAQDFSLFPISYKIGASLKEINTSSDKEYRKLLLTAQGMSDLGYHYLALNLLNENTAKCNIDYFLIKARTYNELGSDSVAISTLDQGLLCDPVNISLLSLAAEYNLKNGNTSQSDFYLSRINYLNQISKEQ